MLRTVRHTAIVLCDYISAHLETVNQWQTITPTNWKKA